MTLSICPISFYNEPKQLGRGQAKKRGGEELFIGAGFMRSINMPDRIHRTGLGAFGEIISVQFFGILNG